MSSIDDDLADAVAQFYADPLGFVMFAYDWDGDKQLHLCELPEPWSLVYNSKYGPDRWACEFLDNIGRQVREHAFDGVTPVAPIREAIASGHGIGKSAMAGWLVDWIMSTRPMSVGTVTANTGPQLESKTWAEIAKWTKRCITGHWFDVHTGRGSMKMTHKKFPEAWKCFAQTCVKENSEAFAGQHAPTGTSFYIFDEASRIEDIINEVSEGGMSDGEPMKFAFGNPTRNTGWFKQCFDGMAHRWGHRHIDSRTVQITNKVNIDEQIKDYGIDSDFVKVRVRGMFPSQSMRQFISTTDVDKAFGKHLREEQYNFAPKILTLDNAWEGDDEWVIGMRQGLRFDVLEFGLKNDNDVVIANKLARYEDQHKADAVFIDGGYGTGVVSIGRTLGRSWMLVWFAEASNDPGCLNKRAEMWKLSRDWLKEGGAIPNDMVLYRDAIGPETVPRIDGKIQLESKADMKKRQVASPNRWDALALSFAHPVHAKKLEGMNGERGAPDANAREYDPLANICEGFKAWRIGTTQATATSRASCAARRLQMRTAPSRPTRCSPRASNSYKVSRSMVASATSVSTGRTPAPWWDRTATRSPSTITRAAQASVSIQ